MADNILRIIPQDPAYVPPPASQAVATAELRRSLPRADDVSALVTPDVRLVDCGINFEMVRCPRCGADVGEWWTLAMEVAHDQRFTDLRITMPCCQRRTSLNRLVYLPPMGFARFRLEAVNPDVVDLPAEVQVRLERLLGCRVRLIWARV